MNFKPKYATNQYSGATFSKTFRLDSGDELSQLEFDALGFTKASVNVTTIGAVGTSGIISINQSVSKGGRLDELAAINVIESSSISEFGLDVLGSHLTLDVNQLTVGSVGKISISVTLK